MSSEQEKSPINVVAVDSSDDEDGVGAGKRVNAPSNVVSLRSRMGAQNILTNPPSVSGNPAPESRSFWKAGAYDIGPTKWDPSQGQLEHARVHPKFLHSNATSHKWAFGAIAELLDNSVDEICNGATFVKVNRIHNLKDNSPALLFQDDGGGMDPDGIRKCMSLGYSSKKANTTIGQYGNGFKTSTMRLGADVIVFSRASCSGRATQSVGLLSYTFLRRTGQDDVIVPMVDFDISDHWAEPIIFSSQDDWSSNLKIILEWSPFASKDELMLQFEDIGSHGTKIIIYNLWLNDEGIFELNFDDDGEDVRLRDETNRASLSRVPKKVLELQSHISYRIRFSLRAYVSILYLKKFTNFQIILRGKPVEQFNIADELKYPKVITYRPQFTMTSNEASVETTIGFIKEAPALGVCGFNVYHKNRLIRPFWKVTGDGSSKGHGVVGVLEANFIEPAHDKQDFERSSLFLRLEMKLKQMIMDYWKGHCQLIGLVPPGVRMRNTQDSPVRPPVGLVANIKKQIHADRHIIGLAPSAQKELHLDQPIIGLAANPKRDPSDAQPGIHGNESLSVQPTIGIASGSVQEMAPVDSSRSTSIDQIGVDNIQLLESVQQMTPVDSSRSASIDLICEENIQLFMRCEEHVQKENELKHTIEELEKQLEETKRKCAQLSLHLENQRKLKMMKQTQKA